MRKLKYTPQFKKDVKKIQMIWIDEKNDVIKLIRLGSHSELFE